MTGETIGLTNKAARFAVINTKARVISGRWLDERSRDVTGPPETWVKLHYRFDNGRQITLTRADLLSMNLNGIHPKWVGDGS